jgi:hypothetical protein
VGDHCCTPTKALSASIFKLRKSRRFRRHHLWHRGRAGPTRGSLRFPSWKRRAQRQLSVKAACAAKSSFSQAGPRAVTSPCVSQSSQPWIWRGSATCKGWRALLPPQRWQSKAMGVW